MFGLSDSMFQPTPRFISEGNPNTRPSPGRRPRFNPPPASSARGTPGRQPPSSRPSGFQPTPRFISEGNPPAGPMGRPRRGFNPPLASSARGTADRRGAGHGRRVSTHPSLHQRGELVRTRARWELVKFQPTPRFISEGNDHMVHVPVHVQRFQPTPRFISEGNARKASGIASRRGFNPPLASSARGTRIRTRRLSGKRSFQPTPRFISEGNPRTRRPGRAAQPV